MAKKGICYCRMKKLTNVVGRRNYISDSKRQEHLEGFYDTMQREDWINLGRENRKQFESMKKKGIMNGLKDAKGNEAKCIEAREIIMHMPHNLALKDPNELARQLAELIRCEYGVDCCVAIHWNKNMSNYHAHIIMSEKVRLNEPWVASRNMFYDSDWKRCKKSEAVHIVKKGDVIRSFQSSKIKDFKTRDFLEKELKPLLAKEVNLEVYRDDGIHLTMQKVGKTAGELRERIVDANDNIREWNRAMDYLLENGADTDELKRFRKICFDMSKKEWREGLIDGMKKLKNNYFIDDNEFVRLWNDYCNIQLQSTYYKPKERDQEVLFKQGFEKKLEKERSVFFLKRDKKEIASLEAKLEATTQEINKLNDYIESAPKYLEMLFRKFKRSKPKFMRIFDNYFSPKHMPEYQVAKEYYDLMVRKQEAKENDKNRSKEWQPYMVADEPMKIKVKSRERTR